MRYLLIGGRHWQTPNMNSFSPVAAPRRLLISAPVEKNPFRLQPRWRDGFKVSRL